MEENVEGNDEMFDCENKSSYGHEDLSLENMSCIRESEGEDDTSNVTVGEESDQPKAEKFSRIPEWNI